MRRPRRILAAFAALVLAGAVGVGAPTAAAADEIPATSAKSPANIEKALEYIDELNTQVRGVERSELTDAQIAAKHGYNVSQIYPGMGTGAKLEPLQVNDQIMAWAQNSRR